MTISFLHAYLLQKTVWNSLDVKVIDHWSNLPILKKCPIEGSPDLCHCSSWRKMLREVCNSYSQNRNVQLSWTASFPSSSLADFISTPFSRRGLENSQLGFWIPWNLMMWCSARLKKIVLSLWGCFLQLRVLCLIGPSTWWLMLFKKNSTIRWMLTTLLWCLLQIWHR